METYRFTVTEQQVNERIDKLLAELLQEMSRSRIQTLIQKKQVTVNGKPVKASYKCQHTDEINIQIPEPEPIDVQPEQMDLDIIYEDSDVIVVNKPRGMVVHPAHKNYSGTLVNGLLAHCKDLSGIKGVIRPGIVHRIDKDTSGLLMVAKNDQAHVALAKQLQEKITERKYIAIVHDHLEHSRGTVNAPIGRDTIDRTKMTVTEKGRKAVTHFQVLERFSKYSLIECELVTGRTHQIRVHMKYIGHPVAGDPKYGPSETLPIKGQALHAETLGFIHPSTQQKVTFKAPLPKDMTSLLNELRT